MRYRRSIVWLRRDLRLDDHAALYEACSQSEAVALTFVVAPALLSDARMGAPLVHLFFTSLAALRVDLLKVGSDLILLEGDFAPTLIALCARLQVDALFFNQDTDPRAIARDELVATQLRQANIAVHACDDLTYFPAQTIAQESGRTYSVFTPYKRRWLAHRETDMRVPFPSQAKLKARLIPKALLGETGAQPTAAAFGYTALPTFPSGSERGAREQLQAFLSQRAATYREARNMPAIAGTSQLSPQLRAGTIGIRTCIELAFQAKQAQPQAQARDSIDLWISELIWREFYHQILIHHPRVVSEPFDARAQQIRWQNSPELFAAWCEARTGYPIIDAAMRQLHTYGWMHNRLRMIVASFLCKDLLIDYRWGELHFEQLLADADVAANNGGWQWSASTGTDAAPYFRVFNPITQSRQFDPEGTFLRTMLPELQHLDNATIHAPWTAPPLLQTATVPGSSYPAPIVDHAAARLQALDAFGAVFGKKSAPL